MAEEQRGNTVAAAGAYRRVMQLDPSRNVEREKLELLYASGAASRPDGEEADGGAGGSALRYAPWIAAVAAGFFVLMILTALGLRVHTGRQAERLYGEHMTQAQAALDSGDYTSAAAAFQAALRARPEDRDAQQGLRYARRRGSLTASAQAAAEIARPIPMQSRIVPSRGPNPFMPVPIGSRDDEPPVPEQPQTTTRPAPRPPVVGTQPVVGGQGAGSQEPTTTEPVPFGPLEPGDEQAREPAPEEQPAETETREPEPRGEITISFSDVPPGGGDQRTATGPTGTTASASGLREQADEARTGGDPEHAAQLYDQAIEAYGADTDTNPGNRQANDAAIEACRRARGLCDAEDGQ